MSARWDNEGDRYLRENPSQLIPRKYGREHGLAQEKCIKWLKQVIKMGQEAPMKGWHRAEPEGTTGWSKHRPVLNKRLSLQEYEPGQLFWQYLENVMEEAMGKMKQICKSKC